MKRGDIFTCADRSGDYTSKPRPVVIVQANETLDNRDSVTVCPITKELIDAPAFRIRIKKSATNGLVCDSDVMADKISSVSKQRIKQKIGSLSPSQLGLLSGALRDWLDL